MTSPTLCRGSDAAATAKDDVFIIASARGGYKREAQNQRGCSIRAIKWNVHNLRRYEQALTSPTLCRGSDAAATVIDREAQNQQGSSIRPIKRNVHNLRRFPLQPRQIPLSTDTLSRDFRYMARGQCDPTYLVWRSSLPCYA